MLYPILSSNMSVIIVSAVLTKTQSHQVNIRIITDTKFKLSMSSTIGHKSARMVEEPTQKSWIYTFTRWFSNI